MVRARPASPPPCGGVDREGDSLTARCLLALTPPPSSKTRLRHDGEEESRDTAWPTDRIWYLLYTSGTTGRPKAVIQTVGMALANYRQRAAGDRPRLAPTRTVNFLPLFHTAGINLHTLPLFIAGGTSTVLPKFEVDPLLDLHRRRARLGCSSACPRSTRRSSLSPRLAATDLTKRAPLGLRRPPLPESLIRAFLARGVSGLQRHGHDGDGPHRVPDGPGARRRQDRLGRQAAAALRGAPRRRRGPRRGRRRAGRDPVPRPRHHARLLRQSRRHAQRHRCATAGCIRATSAGAMRRATTTSSTASRTCTSPAARTCIRPRSRPCSPTTKPCSRRAVIGVPDERWGEVGHAVDPPAPGRRLRGRGRCASSRALRLAAYKVPKHVTIGRRLPAHCRRQGAEAPPAPDAAPARVIGLGS